MVARFNTDGTPDATFGVNGVVTVAEPTPFDGANVGGVAVLNSGLIVVTFDIEPGFGLAAFGPDGSLSLTFGSGGFATTSVGPPGGSFSAPLAMPDGTFVVGGGVGS